MPRQLPGHTLPAIATVSIASRLLPCQPSQFQSRAGCWPASKCGNSTYPFAKALVAANDSGNVPSKKKEYWYGNHVIRDSHSMLYKPHVRHVHSWCKLIPFPTTTEVRSSGHFFWHYTYQEYLNWLLAHHSSLKFKIRLSGGKLEGLGGISPPPPH